MEMKQINKIEVATFLYGIFNVITSGILSGACLFGHVYFNNDLKDTVENVKASQPNDVRKDISHIMNSGMMTLILLLALVIAAVWFSSSVILIIGISKKKAAYVKFFFIYAVSLCVLAVISAVGMMVYSWTIVNYLSVTYVLIGIFIYAFPLVCVYDTYKSYESPNVQLFEEKKLFEA